MKKNLILGVLGLCLGAAALALPLQVEDAWIRPAVAGQQGTGGYMTFKSKEGVTITGVSVPANIGVAELHEMKMQGDVMHMSAVEKLVVPAGQAVQLKPGGYHLMLMGLKAPLPKNTEVPVTFTFKDAKGQVGKVKSNIPVRTTAPERTTPAAEQHGSPY